MAQNIFKGLGIALLTPFTQEGEVDYQDLLTISWPTVPIFFVFLPQQARLLR